MANVAQELKTRYLVIRLDINASVSNATFDNGSTTKYIYAYSGTPSGNNGVGYQRVDVVVQQSIGYQDNTAILYIYGMNVADINTFTKSNLSGYIDFYAANLITIYAGYNLTSSGLPPLLYSGYVISAGPNLNAGQDRQFIIKSMQYFDTMNVNKPPLNIQGIISVDNLFRYICQQNGFIYNGYNVTGNAYNPILKGSVTSQLKQAGQKYGYNVYLTRDPGATNNIVYVFPVNTPRQAGVFTLSASNGMIGYPEVETYGFVARCYFNPNIFVGQAMQVNSTGLTYINNQNLYVNQATHLLHNRDTDWMSTLQLNTWSGVLSGN